MLLFCGVGVGGVNYGVAADGVCDGGVVEGGVGCCAFGVVCGVA